MTETPPVVPEWQIHLVDDDAAFRRSLVFLLESMGWPVQAHASAADYLDAGLPALEQTGCLLLDVRMPGMSGLELQQALIARGCHLPIVFITGHGDVELAVQAMKHGAFDFLEKPFNDNQIVDLALAAIQTHLAAEAEAASRRDLAARRATLSAREDEVMGLMLSGAMNKQIAASLEISMRTVEVHRGRVLAKMGVRNAVELAAMLSADENAPRSGD